MVFLKNEKKKYKITSLVCKEFFELKDSVRSVIENLILAEQNKLICVNNNT